MLTNEQIINILKQEAVPALGCTEPVACAYACAKCREILGGTPTNINVEVSGNILKNGMGVGIPGTGMTGLPIAAALGAICGKTSYGLEVLKDVNKGNNLEQGKLMLANNKIHITLNPDAPDMLYAKATCTLNNDIVTVEIRQTHTNIVRIIKNNEILFYKTIDYKHSDDSPLAELTIRRIWDFIHEVDVKDIDFVLSGAEMNRAISKEGLKSEYGLQIGKTLMKNFQDGLIDDGLLNQALIMSTAASDARMDGCMRPVMTNSGSGNQGITVYLPVLAAADRFGSSQEELARALALSNLVATHIHYYVGHLSALCGIIIAGTGSACAITYLMGGDYGKVVNTIKTMASNLTGMMCDGAKKGCALKVYSGVSAAIQAALLSMNGINTSNDGIIEEDIEKTIQNIGIIGTKGMSTTDKTILEIMKNK
ncbi:MAG: L-serine ammonia-lyase, iron-sulfur-dependent, subunit alpha [Bacteroidales bacterium]|jgi:L-cysteine desulfidase|nr:L-serine ammonia-lyase, iron-sulfur-dependent, subunit alpha [Bacteroidales bacterium]MDD2205610.1 L-serine ammonia-lyase, iron-sulfur-dependent, subunit alpha [Bacteroidales bacterium]MDD3153059.1 L-serine ammonia-lyase, iron-sulfur-dependent, subunit alpha [Bacteroidales bacterium]MDD3915002.1 L-serine ammonia-lyase, iron-sulfur-dependent, subunit alpha [Bacteroidales bacterium]MDD4633735.1 L-serine ammonia-lyase, iron-sulfur-dependent, subunit alpha [Bacteroidales bacterium]